MALAMWRKEWPAIKAAGDPSAPPAGPSMSKSAASAYGRRAGMCAARVCLTCRLRPCVCAHAVLKEFFRLQEWNVTDTTRVEGAANESKWCGSPPFIAGGTPVRI